MVVILIVGDQLINDIVIVLCIFMQDVEDIKICYGVVLQQLVDLDEMFEVLGVGDCFVLMLLCQVLVGFIQLCVEEIFQKVQEEFYKSGYERFLCVGIVLIGGIVVMFGMVEFGEEIFYNMVKFGVLQYEGNLCDFMKNLCYFMVMGLLLEGMVQIKWGMKVQDLVNFVQVLVWMCVWFVKNF